MDAVPETHSRVRSDVHREGKRGQTSGRTNNIVPQHALHAQCMHACVHTRSHPANRTSAERQQTCTLLILSAAASRLE